MTSRPQHGSIANRPLPHPLPQHRTQGAIIAFDGVVVCVVIIVVLPLVSILASLVVAGSYLIGMMANSPIHSVRR